MIIIITEFLTDEELVMLVVNGVESAFSELFKRYKRHSELLSGVYVKSYKSSGILFDEFEDVCLMAFYDALRSYKRSRLKFYSYWRVVAKNKLNTYLRQHSLALGRNTLGVGISLDSYIESGRDTSFSVEDKYQMYADDIKDIIRDIFKDPKYSFTEEEKAIGLLVYLHGYTPASAIRVLGWEKNHGNYVMSLVRLKFIRIFNELYCK